ncbi:MAG TPA: HAD-IA family hydrolase [Thermoanaerobaculia bacterium]|nr:HAD-IA family hydrolase [Thermoanaerobaculia bacterium]
MQRPAALVFDLDGTLIDSRRDIATAVNRMRADLGLPSLTLEQVVSLVGEGARLLVRRALGGDVPEDEVDRALAIYLEHYRRVCLDTTQPYPGVDAMLRALARSYPLAVLSNKGESLSRIILDGLGLTPLFREVLGGDSLPTRKPDPAGLGLLAERLDVPVEELVLIGDSWVDAETARSAGCGFVLVEWGFPRQPFPAGLEVDVRTSDAGELTALLGNPEPP